MKPSLYFKFKTLLFFLLISLSIPIQTFAQIVQDAEQEEFASFVPNTESTEGKLQSAFYTFLSIGLSGLSGLVINRVLDAKGLGGQGSMALAEASGCTAFAMTVFGSSAFLWGSAIATGLGALVTVGTGFPWLAIHKEAQNFQKMAPFVILDCQTTSPISYAPVNITCNSTASFAQANGASLQETQWDFGDGVGFQKRNESIQNYFISNPGTYNIQVRITDTLNNVNTASFALQVPNGAPQTDIHLNYSNPYQSAPTNITFTVDPVQAIYPCSVATGLTLQLPNEDSVRLLVNETYSFLRNYTVPGTYAYSFEATDSSGRLSQKNLSFTLSDPKPIAIIEGSVSLCQFHLDPQKSHVNFPTTIESYHWTSLNLSIITHPPYGAVDLVVYECGSNPIVTLTVTDAEGRSSTSSVQLYTSRVGWHGCSCSF